MTEVILCTSSKGGVGKTEITKMTARQLKRDGHDVAMMDADIDSSNLSTRMGIDERLEHNEDDLVVPAVKEGIKVYSMESAFTDSSFSQSGEFMRLVIRNMVDGAAWDDPDYLVVDCPPGTKDIFDELVNVFREDLLGAIVIGQSDSLDDIGRMTKVCNHNFVPIIGYVENMSGVFMNGELIEKGGTTIAPFGRGNISAFAEKVNGRFLGHIPLCHHESEIEQAAANTIKGIAIAIQDAERPEMPDLSEGDKGFIKNVWLGLKSAIKTVNDEFDIGKIQEDFGNPAEPKTIAFKLTDATGIPILPDTIHIKVENGLKIVRSPGEVYGGVEITSQELRFALDGKRLTMDSPRALYSDNVMDDANYGLVDAVQMGKADVWGDEVINYLSLLDRLFEEMIDEEKLHKAVQGSKVS